MFRIYFVAVIILVALSCTQVQKTKEPTDNKDIATLLNNYYEDRLKLEPLEATAIGDTRYNDLLPVDFTESYEDSMKVFFSHYLDGIKKIDSGALDENDQISYAIFKREMQMDLEELTFHENYIPFNQFYSLPLTLGQFGSGEGAQPFKTLKDYRDWEKRAAAFSAWADSAIVYFKKGMAENYVLPKSLVVKIIPQMEAMVTSGAEKNLFYGPINKMPKSFSTEDSSQLKKEYISLINEKIIPSYKKLADFLKNEYLPKARTTSGINALSNGDAYYKFRVRDQTTTNKTPEEIYQIGLSEVARIRGIMDSVKNAVGFKGDLPAFFTYMKTDKKFMPYKTPQEVLDAFEAIHKRMQPNLQKMFTHVPKTPFEIRQTEAFRAASASAEYNQGSPDGSRPGIFYVPILDATKFNTTSGMESLFLHEAIPGHHYQISLQQEDTLLPKFRRFGGNNAYVEGWALYCESLGKELGLYTDPYQYMGALGDEIHRAIRLVVDVAIHTKGMTREEAIKYMMNNEPISEQGATAEIERYMAIPGQALGYKIGALKIRELRNKYQQQLGDKFSLAAFHDEVLKDGAMPLEVLEHKMDAWAQKQK
ncbi:MAG: DUF885 domain-containing protein [Bacteroidetes bacterium]|nr:DUF885 domain-containing protein [Bacteroidota bacterium]MBS1932498.1 DUF885 domain-containing protein [Bacteroidota bacterium]